MPRASKDGRETAATDQGVRVVTVEQYVSELIALSQSKLPRHEVMARVDTICHRCRVDFPGVTGEALLDAFRNCAAPKTPLTVPIIDRLISPS
jgi:hypothetical protein